jgi:hypothetical protein
MVNKLVFISELQEESVWFVSSRYLWWTNYKSELQEELIWLVCSIDIYDEQASFYIRAPGRVNMIGKF